MAEVVSAILQQLNSMKHDGRILNGDKEKLQEITTKFKDIQSVLRDAETRQMKAEDVRDWLENLKDTSYDIEDVLDEWNTNIRKVDNSIPLDFNNLITKLESIAREKDQFQFSLTQTETESSIGSVDVYTLSREQEQKKLLDLLLSESRQGPIFPIISIVGMKGSGKTTLAQQIFNNIEMDIHFDKKMWVQATDLSDVVSIAKAILKCLNIVAPNIDEPETLFGWIQQSFRGSKFLLVLDDLCIESPKYWVQMRSFLENSYQGSKILATIRYVPTTGKIGTTSLIALGKLSSEEAWLMFSKIAFTDEFKGLKELEDIGRQIVTKCDCLPFTLNILGGLLRSKTTIEEWKRVLDSELWKLEHNEFFFSSILLRYYDLPTSLRKCFSSCVIFPKGYKLKKDTLINLWMALDYITIEGEENIEKVGEKYIYNLAYCSFFQDLERSMHNDKIISCKITNVVYDVAQILTKNECCILKVDDLREPQFKFYNKKVRHLRIENSIPTSTKIKKLPELKSGFEVGKNFRLFDQLTCLRTLDLSDCSILVLSSEIKKLVHLRYLNLSHNEGIEELPETLCELYNLRVLDISNCQSLEKLPHGMGKLRNLLHLINYATPLLYMPRGIEKLTCLRTLNKFALIDLSNYRREKRKGRKQRREACRLKDLAKLDLLRGFLIITGLGSDVDEHEIRMLGRMQRLVGLCLRFDALEDNYDEEIFRGLEPPPNLEEFMLQHYRGETMSLDRLMWPKKLRVLKLSFCVDFQRLPALGKLEFLESLYISNMINVERVGKEFYGSGCLKHEGKEDFWGEEIDIFFPKLITLKFQYMNKWAIWEDDRITLMPCLQSLTIGHCHILEALPFTILSTPSLKILNMYNCSLLNKRYNKNTGKEWPIISHILNIKIDGRRQN